ncbi:MAG: hypothetical protein GTO13_14895 [Proteobacteria bacterium]|nr:hypothetical protein [Pseudomonadota bacterium]
MAKKERKAPEKKGETEGEYRYEEKTSFDGKKVKVLGPTFEKGQPDKPENWRKKLGNREEKLNYLKTGERYWFSQEWFGSEKRKTPA